MADRNECLRKDEVTRTSVFRNSKKESPVETSLRRERNEYMKSQELAYSKGTSQKLQSRRPREHQPEEGQQWQKK